MEIGSEALAALSEGDNAAALSALFNQGGAANPRKQAVLELLSQQMSSRESEADPGTRRYARLVHRAKAQIHALRSQLELALDAMDLFAGALGACEECFGTDEHCAVCNGAGRPGSCEVDPDLFRRWIEPAVLRHRRDTGEQRAQTHPRPDTALDQKTSQ